MDLNNIQLSDISAKLKTVDKKTLIKFGIGFGAILIFLIGYYMILNPIVKSKKALYEDKVLKQNEIEQFENEIILNKKRIKKLEPEFKEQAEELLEKTDISYYQIPVEYEIKGNFLGYIKFKRAISKSKKMLNFDKETISVVQNSTTGAIVAKGELTIVGIPDEFF